MKHKIKDKIGRAMGKGTHGRIKIEYDSPVVLTFAFCSLFALISDALTGGAANVYLFSVYRSPLSDPLFYARLFCHVLGHAGFSHFFGNMTLFLIVGPAVERRYGSRDLLISMALTALASGILHVAVSADTALLGASGIVFLCIFLSAVDGVRDGKLSLSFILVAVIYLGQAIYEGIFVRDSVSQLAHIVGGVCGIACGLYLGRQKRRGGA